MKPPAKGSFDRELPHEHESTNKKQPHQVAPENPKSAASSPLPALTYSLSPKAFIVLVSLLDNSKWFYTPCHAEKLFDNFKDAPVLHIRPKFKPYISLLLHELYEYELIDSDNKKCYLQIAARLIYCNGQPLDPSSMSKQNYKTLSDPETFGKIIEKVAEFLKTIEQANGKILIRKEKKKSEK